MKEPRTTTPGRRDRWDMRISMTRRKIKASDDVAISNGKTLFFGFFLLVLCYLFFKGGGFFFQSEIDKMMGKNSYRRRNVRAGKGRGK